MKRNILIGLALVLVGIQFIRPEPNNSKDENEGINTVYPIPNDVQEILRVACYDCHSNFTRQPWYASVQPIAFFLNKHIQEGKDHLNFSEFANLPIAVRYHKLEETMEVVDEKEMPLASYTYMGLHTDAKLTDAQRKLIINWAKDMRNQMSKTFPSDSLVFKRKKQS